MQEQLAALRVIAERTLDMPDRPIGLPGVGLHRGRAKPAPSHSVTEPSLVLVLQGAKRITVGDRTLRYDPAHYFVSALALPVTSWVVEGTAEQPYLSLSLRLDRTALCGLILDMPPEPPCDAVAGGFAVSAVTPALLDALSRLLHLLDTPDDLPVLAPLHEREVLYRLLQGPQGPILRAVARADSRLGQIRRAIGFMREHFTETLRVEALAEHAGMSPASFHRHFKAATALSPLQYQKRLRLQAARRLLVDSAEVARAGHRVGYESASQFSRDYVRLFGSPPGRDTERLRFGSEPRVRADAGESGDGAPIRN